MRQRDSIAVLALVAVFFGGCVKRSESGGDSPTAPSPPAPVIPGPPGLPTVVSTSIENMTHTVVLGWAGLPGATSYVLNFTTRQPPGLTFTTRSEEVTPTQFVLTEPGFHTITIRAKNSAGVSPPSAARSVQLIDMRDALDALFFSRGHYADREIPRERDRLLTWPSGAVPIRVENAPDNERATIAHVGAQFAQSTGRHSFPTSATPTSPRNMVFTGAIRLFTVPVGDADSSCGGFLEREIPACASFGSAAGVIQWGWVIASPSVTYPPAYIMAHEVAHTFGLLHIRIPEFSGPPTGYSSDLIMRSPLPREAPIEFSPIEMELIRQVYSNGFGPGTPRTDLIIRGLIKQ